MKQPNIPKSRISFTGIWLVIAAFILIPFGAYAQQITVKGIVVDNTGEPIIGASVMDKNNPGVGTATDTEGRFILQVKNGSTIKVSYIGYTSTEIKATAEETRITLHPSDQNLDEIVVVGYGTQRREELTSSVASVKSNDFVQASSIDAASLIRGKVAGLTVIQSSGDPLATSQIMLRGVTTLASSSSPLVIIDGIEGNLNDVSPNDIEQIDVLKDGSAAAIYGTRGTNGVVIITTKKAKAGSTATIDVNTYISTQRISRKLDMLTPDEYAALAQKGVTGALDFGSRTDWMKEITQNPFNKTLSVSLKGAYNNTSYLASVDYTDNQGIIKESGLRVLYPRINVVHSIWDNILKIEAQLSGYQRSYGPSNAGAFHHALIYNPTYSIKKEDGSWNEDGSSPIRFNPVALIEESDSDNESTSLKMHGKITLNPLRGLNISWLLARNINNFYGSYYETHKHNSTTMYGKNGYASQTSSRNQHDMMEFTAHYTKSLKQHNFDALAGYSWNDYNYRYAWMDNYNFPSDDYKWNNMGIGSALKDGMGGMSTTQNSSRLIGWFARLNYNYAGKYFLSASVRYEGSSKFGANHKWGTFPAVSAGWSLSKENFMKDIEQISNLKFRVGYGITGTIPASSYMSLARLNLGGYSFYKGEWITQLKADGNSNPDLRWEKKKELNIGLDYGFFNNRIFGGIDYYVRTTDDLIWNYQVPVPPYVSTTLTSNSGSIRNSGIEISVNAIPVETKDFVWNTNLNFSTNKSKLVSLSNDKYLTNNYIDGLVDNSTTHRLEVGKPLGNFYGYKTVGINEEGEWLIEGADGSVKKLTEKQASDRQVIGNALPKFYLNFNNSLKYKWFDLNVTMRGAFDFKIYNYVERNIGVPMALGSGNVLARAFEPKLDGRVLNNSQPNDFNGYVSYFVENGDFWKIDNVTLGFTPNIGNFKWIKKIRIYASVSNLATITGYSGVDPETNILGLTPGVDNFQYPTTRTYTLGINLTF